MYACFFSSPFTDSLILGFSNSIFIPTYKMNLTKILPFPPTTTVIFGCSKRGPLGGWHSVKFAQAKCLSSVTYSFSGNYFTIFKIYIMTFACQKTLFAFFSSALSPSSSIGPHPSVQKKAGSTDGAGRILCQTTGHLNFHCQLNVQIIRTLVLILSPCVVFLPHMGITTELAA